MTDESARVPVREGLFREQDDHVVLLVGRCGACDAPHFPRGGSCPTCGSGDVVEETAGAAGARLWGFTAVNAAPPGYHGRVPYGFGVVELAEGLRVISRLTEDDPSTLARGRGGRFVAEVLHRDDAGRDVVTYAFEPEQPS